MWDWNDYVHVATMFDSFVCYEKKKQTVKFKISDITFFEPSII